MISSVRKRAFTLLEILLVVLVIGITVAAFLPVALNSVDQARTRSFMRQVISLNRYARSRAVLERTPMTLVYDAEQGRIEVVSSSSLQQADDEVEDEENAPPSRFARQVPETMRIRKVEGVREHQEGLYHVRIDEEGVGMTHEVELVDPRGEVRRLRFNGFTGEADIVEGS